MSHTWETVRGEDLSALYNELAGNVWMDIRYRYEFKQYRKF